MTVTNATRIRPKYHLKSKTPPSLLLEEIQHRLAESSEVIGKIVENHVYLCMPESEQHYWSPELRINIDSEGGETTIRGIAGPNGKVWATFMVFYLLAVMLFIFGGSLGVSAWFLGLSSDWLWSIPASVVLYLIILFSAKYGQKLGRSQLMQLRGFLDQCIAQADMRHRQSVA